MDATESRSYYSYEAWVFHLFRYIIVQMSGEIVHDEAFVSLVTNNSYANGALVLGYSLRRVNTTRKLVLMVSREVLEPTR